MSFVLAGTLMLVGGRALAQTGETNNSKVLGVFIMEDVLFKGIASSNQAELLNKKIQRVEQEIADPAQKESNAAAEASRQAALIQIKSRLLAQKNNLPINKTR